MESKPINVATGVVRYSINDAVEVAFNPTDAEFIRRLFEVFDALDGKQEAYKAAINKAQKREVFDLSRKFDADMREMVDGALGAGVCDAVFGGMCLYALADGLPVWANLMLALLDEVDSVFAREQKQTNVRLQKYSAKYKK